MLRIAVIGVDNVAYATTASTIVSGMIVGSGKRQQLVEEPGLLQAQKNWIGAQQRAEAPVAQLHVRTSWLILILGIAYLATLAAASLEHPQHIAGLRDLPSLQRYQAGEDPF